MFLLLKRVRGWRLDMLARAACSPGELSELEDHLLEQANNLIDTGLTDEQAFLEALRRLGTVDELTAEYQVGHTLNGRTFGSVWTVAVVWLGGLCRWLRNVLVFCLPGLVFAVPGLIASSYMYTTGAAATWWSMPPLSAAAFRAVVCFWRFRLLLVPLLLLFIVLPTVVQGWLEHMRGQLDVPALLRREAAASRALLLAGLVAYPLVGFVLCHVAFGPLIKMITYLGG